MRNWNQLFVVLKGPRPPIEKNAVGVLTLCTVVQWTFLLWVHPSCLLTSYYLPLSKLRSKPEFLEFMSQKSQFLGSRCVLKVQVKSQGQRFFSEHVDQGLRGGRDQFWLCIVHNTKSSVCHEHCCCHLMSRTQNIFVVLQFILIVKA